MQDRKYDWSGVVIPGLDDLRREREDRERERQKRKSERERAMRPATAPGGAPILPSAGEVAKSVGGAIGGAAAGMAAGVPVGAARTLEGAIPDTLSGFAVPRPTAKAHDLRIGAAKYLVPPLDQGTIPGQALGLPLPPGQDVRPEWAERAGMFLDSLAKETVESAPKPDPRLEDSFWLTTLPSAATSAALFAASGVAGRALGLGNVIPTAASGALAESGGMYLEAEALLQKRVAEGAMSEEEAKRRAFMAWLGGLGLGATEVVPISRMLNRLDRRWRGSLSKIIKDGVLESVEEAAQEAGQTAGSNLWLAELTGEDIKVMEGVGEGSAAGAIIGAVMSMGFTSMQRFQRGARYREVMDLREARLAEAQTQGLPQELAAPIPPSGSVAAPDLIPPEAGGLTGAPPPTGPAIEPLTEQPSAEPVGGAPAAGPGAVEPGAAPSVDLSVDPVVQTFVRNALDIAAQQGQAVPEDAAGKLSASAREDTGPVGQFARKLGARLIAVGEAGGGRLALEGQAFPDAVVVDSNLGPGDRARQIFAHETLGHFTKQRGPEQWRELRSSLDELAPDLMASWRSEMEEQRSRLGMQASRELIEEEGVAKAAEETVGFIFWSLRNRGRARALLEEARKRETDPGRLGKVLRFIADALRNLGRKLGIGRGSLDYQLALLSHRAAVSAFEAESPEASLEIADRFVQIVDALTAQTQGAPQAAQEDAGATRAAPEAEAADIAAGVSAAARRAQEGGRRRVPAEAGRVPARQEAFAQDVAETIERQNEALGQLGQPITDEQLRLDVEERLGTPRGTAFEGIGEQPQGQEEEPGATTEAPSPAPGAPSPEIVAEVSTALGQRQANRASRLHRELAKELGVPAGEAIELEKARRKQLVRASREAGIRMEATRVADMRAELAKILSAGYTALERMAGVPGPQAIAQETEEGQLAASRRKQERSRQAKDRQWARLRDLRDGVAGDFRSFVRAWGGVNNRDGHFAPYTEKEIGEKRPFGMGAVAHPKGSDKGLPWDTLASTAIEVGYFPGRTSHDFSLDDFIQALASNPVAPDLVGMEAADASEERALREQQEYEEWLENASPEEIDAYERSIDAEGRFSIPRDDKGRVWFSAVSEAITGMPQETMQPRQFRDWLNKQPGVTAEELDYLDLWEYVSGQERITRADVLEYVREHRVEVTEKVLGGAEQHTLEVYNNDFMATLPTVRYRDGGIVGANDIAVDVASGPGTPAENLNRYGIVRGDADPGIEDLFMLAPQLQDIEPSFWPDRTYPLPPAEYDALREQAEALRAAYDARNASDTATHTKFGEYTLPGGENYRELLLTWPEVISTDRSRPPTGYTLRPLAIGMWQYSGENVNSRSYETEAEAVRAAWMQYDDYRRNEGTATVGRFTGGHFDEPNVLAHIRFNDRTGPAGEKVLFIEEIQSDWHQQGREKGYTPTTLPPMPEWVIEWTETGDEEVPVTGRLNPETFPDDDRELSIQTVFNEDILQGNEYVITIGLQRLSQRRYPSIQEAMDWAVSEMDGLAGIQRQGPPEGVPDAPFKTDWHVLALKRAIKWAVDNGYDSVAWTTGVQQVDRYETELRQRVEGLEWAAVAREELERYTSMVGGVGLPEGVEPENVSAVNVDGARNRLIFRFDRTTGVIWDAPGAQEARNKTLAEVFGKDTAARILAEPEGVLTGEDLTVGGKGMQTFYDVMLPKAADKLGKRYGTGVMSRGVMLDPDARTGPRVHTLPIPAAMREAIAERGFSTFAPKFSLPGGPAQMPEEEGLFGKVEKPARKPIPKPESMEQQGKLFDTGEDDLPGQRLLDDYYDDADEKGTEGTLFSLPAAQRTARGITFADQHEGILGRLNRRLMYDFAPVANVIAGLREAGAEVKPSQDVARKEELFYGRRADDVKRVKRLQSKLIRLMRRNKIDLEEIDDYLRALHAGKRNEAIAKRHPFTFDQMASPGSGRDSKGRLLNPGTIREILDSVSKDPRADAFKAAAAIVHQVNQEALQRRVDYGLLSAAGRDEWVNQFGQEYVPLRDSEEAGKIETTYRVGRGYQIPRKLSHRAEGRLSTSGSPTIWSFAQAESIASQARRNEVMLSMAALVRKHFIPNFWRVSDDGLTSEQQRSGAEGGPYFAVHFKERGQDRFIILQGQHGERIYNALTKMDSESMGLYLRLAGGAGRWFKRMATQWNPGFLLRNLVKDVPTAMIRTAVTQGFGSSARLVFTLPKAWAGIYGVLSAEQRGEEGPDTRWANLYRQFRQDGAETGYTALLGYGERLQDMEKALNKGDARMAFRAVWEGFKDVQQAVEVGTRLSVYEAALSRGMSREDAASEAKNVTVNFNRKGELGPIIDAWSWFYNPSVQGTRMVLKTMGTPKGAAITGAIMALGYLMAWMNRIIGEDDERNRWDETSDWIKNGYGQVLLPEPVSITLPWGTKMTVDRLMAPLAWGWNIPFVVGTQLAEINHGHSQPEEALPHVLSAITESFNPMGASPTIGQFFAPSLLDPLAQVSENTSFTGGSVRPKDYGTKAPSELYWEDVPSYAKTITDTLNRLGGGNRREGGRILGINTSFSPESLDHVVRAYAGGGSTFAIRTAQFMTDFLSGEEIAAREVPIARSFIGEADERTLNSQFWRAIRRVETTRRVIEKDGDVPRNPDLYSLSDAAKEYSRIVKDLDDAGATSDAVARMREFMAAYYEVIDAR